MDFLDDLLDFGHRRQRRRGGYSSDEDPVPYDDDDHDHRHSSPPNRYSESSTHPPAFQPGILCRQCSTQTVRGARFCHMCGAALEISAKCAGCGSVLAPEALFCPQCGSRRS